jgi:hypothetical protein
MGFILANLINELVKHFDKAFIFGFGHINFALFSTIVT